MEEKFILANITWNSNRWEKISSDPSDFKAVKNRSNIAGESYNFEPIKGKWRYGFFERRGKIRRFADGGVIFFKSKNQYNKKSYIIGFYAMVEIIDEQESPSGHYCNVRGHRIHCIKLNENEYIDFEKNRHLPEGKGNPRYFLYLSAKEAKNLFVDMINNCSNLYKKNAIYKTAKIYFPDLKVKTEKNDNPTISKNLLEFVHKEYDIHSDKDIIEIIKNNSKLQRSYSDHEKLRSMVADYYRDSGYQIYQDKHLDLFAINTNEKIIIEIKSCRADNLLSQVRLGVSQLMYYSFLYGDARNTIKCCLAIQKEPSLEIKKFIVEHCGYDLVYLDKGRLTMLQYK